MRLPLLLLATALLAPLPAAAQPGWSLEDLLQVRFVDGPAISPDGKWVAHQVTAAKTGPEQSALVTQLWLAAADGSRSFPLTHGGKGSFGPAFSPDGSSVAFLSARGGDAVDLWLLPMAGGEARRLTAREAGVDGFKWSPDGKEIAFLAREPESAASRAAKTALDDPQVVGADRRFRHLWRVAAHFDGNTPPEPRRVTQGDFWVETFDWSPDGKRFVLTTHPTPEIYEWRRSDLALVAADGGEPAPLVSDPGMDTFGLFSPDGETIAFVSDRGNRVWARDWRLCLIPAAGGPVTVLPRTFDSMPGENINAELVGWAGDGSGLYYAENHGTSVDLYFAPRGGGPYRQITTLPGFKSGFRLSPDRRTVVFSYEDLTQPAEIYLQPLDGAARAVTSHNRDLPARAYSRSEVVRWPGPGGELEGVYHHPLHEVAGERPPLLLALHGGPTYDFYRNYTASLFNPTQVFTAAGFAVLEVNPRGSAGYGKDFRFANLGDWGGGDVADVLSGVDWAIARGWADPARLGVFGASYGGFLTGMVIAKSPRFGAAVLIAGTTNMISDAGTTDLAGFNASFMQSEFWEKPELWIDRSAVMHAPRIKTPTLILFGANDPRVPPAQGQELYSALQRVGTPTELVLYPRSGHGVGEPKLALDFIRRQVEWFEKYLGAGNRP